MANVAYIEKKTKNLILVPNEFIVEGTTLKKVINNFVKPVLINELKNLNQIQIRYFTCEEVLENAEEFISFGGDKILPILELNNKPINDGKRGTICEMM